ncbi:hypothetical protein C1H46_034099 [Malus baccata]|uniref:Uncharacterized protein n=1 Tax=Malus baccata TaxID=106549 RepID=A0A540L1H7_MALBA|nr:hypothetical protein C1H46_034099 [Malus baccata]
MPKASRRKLLPVLMKYFSQLWMLFLRLWKLFSQPWKLFRRLLIQPIIVKCSISDEVLHSIVECFPR